MAGMVSLGGRYTALAVEKRGGKLFLQQRTGNWTRNDEVRADLETLDTNMLYVRMRVEKETDISFEISADAKTFRTVGNTTQATPGRWVGVKAGLFALNEKGLSGGSMRAEYFVFEKLV